MRLSQAWLGPSGRWATPEPLEGSHDSQKLYLLKLFFVFFKNFLLLLFFFSYLLNVPASPVLTRCCPRSSDRPASIYLLYIAPTLQLFLAPPGNIPPKENGERWAGCWLKLCMNRHTGPSADLGEGMEDPVGAARHRTVMLGRQDSSKPSLYQECFPGETPGGS